MSFVIRSDFLGSGSRTDAAMRFSAWDRSQEEEHTKIDKCSKNSAIREATVAVSGLMSSFEGVQLVDAPMPERFNCNSPFGVVRDLQHLDTSQPNGSKPVGGMTNEVSFGSFRLLRARFTLLEGDKPVPLGSRALDILMILLERPGELVTSQELMARVWPNVVVGPANIAVNVYTLRRALRDGRDGNRFIVNVPKCGYCFIAPVR